MSLHVRPGLARPSLRCAALLLGAGLVVCVGLIQEAQAQRPYRIHDVLYRSETAEQVFFDGYAFTAELFYRSAGDLQSDGEQTLNAGLGVSLRVDYQLAPRLDLGAIIDASGSNFGRTLSLSWLVAKYHWTVDHSDYAFRLAVDPASDGWSGFPQTDLAFFANSLMSAAYSTDFAIGVRRVRRGYWTPVASAEPAPEVQVPEALPPTGFEAVFQQAVGWEIHLMLNYNWHLDPAGSKVFASFAFDRGQYRLLEYGADDEADPADPAGDDRVSYDEITAPRADAGVTATSDYRGGVVWLRTGVEYSRPGYQFSPFVGYALKRWAPEAADPRARFQLGVRLMLR